MNLRLKRSEAAAEQYLAALEPSHAPVQTSGLVRLYCGYSVCLSWVGTVMTLSERQELHSMMAKLSMDLTRMLRNIRRHLGACDDNIHCKSFDYGLSSLPISGPRIGQQLTYQDIIKGLEMLNQDINFLYVLDEQQSSQQDFLLKNLRDQNTLWIQELETALRR